MCYRLTLFLSITSFLFKYVDNPIIFIDLTVSVKIYSCLWFFYVILPLPRVNSPAKLSYDSCYSSCLSSELFKLPQPLFEQLHFPRISAQFDLNFISSSLLCVESLFIVICSTRWLIIFIPFLHYLQQISFIISDFVYFCLNFLPCQFLI